MDKTAETQVLSILTVFVGKYIIITIIYFTGGSIITMEDSDSCADPNQNNNLNE